MGVATITAERSCRIGRVRGDPATGYLIAEIIFDRVLRAGETAVFDFRVEANAARDRFTSNRRFTRSVREYILRVNFDPSAVPARCYQYRQESLQDNEIDVQELWIGTTASAHTVALDVVPGIIGIRREWA